MNLKDDMEMYRKGKISDYKTNLNGLSLSEIVKMDYRKSEIRKMEWVDTTDEQKKEYALRIKNGLTALKTGNVR